MKRILFDQNVPRKLARHLARHRVELSLDRGWSTLTNGDLIAAADSAGFDVLVTADQNLAYQQNLAHRRLAIVVLDSNRWAVVDRKSRLISAAIDAATDGSFEVVRIFSPRK